MKTTILITEQQKRVLISESLNDKIRSNVRDNYELFKRVSKFSNDEFSNNLGFLLTWGAGVGGFIGPVNDLLKGEYPELSEREIILILLAVIGTLFLQKRDFIANVIHEIESNGLTEVFKRAKNKASQLKSTFIKFLESIDVTVSNLISMLSYSFLIPSLIPIVNFIESGHSTEDDIIKFITSIGASKLVTLSGKTLSEFFKKLIKKLR